MANGDVVRNLRLKLALSGTRQTDRGLKKTADGVTRVGDTAETAAKQTTGFADALLKGSEAADKKIKKLEGVFAGSDRVASVVGKVTAAIGLGTLAYKGITAVMGLFNDKQKRIAATGKQVTASFAEATRQMKLFGRAGSAAMKLIGDADFALLDPATRAQATGLQRRASDELSARTDAETKLAAVTASLTQATADLRDAERTRAGFIASRAAVPGRTIGRIAGLQQRVAMLTRERDKQLTSVKALTDSAFDAQQKLDAFNASLQTSIQGFSSKERDKIAADPVTGGAPSTPRQMTALSRAIDAALIAGAQRFEMKLVNLLQQLRNPLPLLDATPARSAAAFGALGDAFSSFRPMADGAVRAFTPMVDKLKEMAVAFKQVATESHFMAGFRDTLSTFGKAGADSLLQAGVAAAFYGESIKAAIGNSLTALGIEATVQALKSTALGIGALAMGDPKAPLFFKQAGVWTAVGAASGVAGAALGGGGGGGASPVAAAPSRRDLPPDRSGGGGTNITINMDMKSRPFATQREIEDAVTRTVTNGLRRAGGPGAAFRRELDR